MKLKTGKSKFLFLIIQFFLLTQPLFGQLNVYQKRDLLATVKALEGPGVKFSNISIYQSIDAEKKPIGYFEDQGNTIGLNKGLILTTGAAEFAEGPNNVLNKGQNNLDFTIDTDLSDLAGSTSLYDLCYVEFDVITSSSTLSFNYVFASEEYTEYNNYGDIFAFLISGPGINGVKNLAVIPGTNTPVSVTNINNIENSQYFVYNKINNPNIQYDGYTVKLKATTKVLPCQTYHIKLAIADAIDHIYDSGVFIEQGSFVSEEVPQLSIYYDYPNFDYGIEGCNRAHIVVKRNPIMTDNVKLKYDLTFAGSALTTIDYISIPDSVVIPAGKDTALILLDFIKDGLKEPEENVKIAIKSTCPVFPDIASINIPVRDIFPYQINNDNICTDANTILNQSADETKVYTWESDPHLSCLDCSSPLANPDTTQFFNYTIKDIISGCEAKDSVLVSVLKVTADFSFDIADCYTSLDIFFTNNSKNGNNYLWTFGDGKTSDIANPNHYFPYLNKQESQQYNVTLTTTSNFPRCSSQVTKTIQIPDPVYIPNLFTPGGDGKNDCFIIKGLGLECWTLTFYNKWGGVVFTQSNYNNDFNGGDLDEGIYFYHIHNTRKDREFKGWVHLIRESKEDR